MDQLSLPFVITDANGDPSPGALINVYNRGTTDRSTVYADKAAAAQHPNPVVCNGSGQRPQIFYNGGEDLEVVITTAAGVTLRTFDPVALIDDGTLPDGTEAEPGIRFTDDPDTGFRRAGANDMRAVTGGADVAAFTSTGLDVTGAISVDGNPLFGTRDLASFGVTGSGDEDVALEAALQWSAAEKGRKLIGGKIEQVRITRLISATGHVQVDLSGVTIVKTTEAARIRWLNPPLANQPLSGSYTAGDTTIDVDDLGAAYEAGTPFHIGSDAVDPANRDSGSASSQYRVTEIGFLGTGSTNATLQLDSPLRRTAGISPISTAGDEARIDPYTTAPDTELNPRVMIYNAATNVDVVLPNVEAPAGEDWASSAMFTFSGYVGGNIYLGKVTRGYGPYLLLNGTVNVTVHEGLVQNLRNAPSDGAFGYGIENRGYGTRINGLNGSETRHLYTTNTIAIPANSTDADTRFATGRVEAFQVIGGAATGGDLAPWDTHHCADGGLFDNNVTMSSRGTAHLVRGRGVTVRNPAITGAVAIGQVLTEFNSGSPDDDLYTAGKTRDDISEAIFDGVFAEDITGPIYKANHGVLTLTGGGRVTASHQTVIENEGGIFNVQDAPVFVLGGAGENGEAIIKTTGVASQMSAVSGLGFTYINADMVIDARGITATGVVGISCAAGTTTVVRGDLTLILPDGATLFSTTGTIITEGRGRILYRIDGTGTLNTDSHPGAVVRRTTTETWGGPLTPEDFGATDDGTTDFSAPIQAMFDASRDTGIPWRISGTYNVADTELTCYTSGDMSGGELQATASGQGVVLTIAPLTADVTDDDATLLSAANADLPWARGQTRIPALAAYEGEFIRLAVGTKYLLRAAGDTQYRHEIMFEVLDDEGTIWPPIAHDVAGSITFSTAQQQVLRNRVVVKGGTIRFTSGTTETGAGYSVSRCNVETDGLKVINDTTASIRTGINTLNFASSGYFKNCEAIGMNEVSTNYGFSQTGSGAFLDNCREYACRRGFDGTYSNHTRITGGSFPDGIGAHLGFDGYVTGADIGCDAPNTAPLYWSGGEITVDNCRFNITPDTQRAVTNRAGPPEIIGHIRLQSCQFNFDLKGLSGAQTLTLLKLEYAGATAYDPGRDIAWPKTIRVTDPEIRLINGSGVTPTLSLLDVDTDFDELNADGWDLDVGSDMSFTGFSIDWGGATPAVTMTATKQSLWTGRTRLKVEDLEKLTVTWDCPTAALGTAGRAEMDMQRIGNLALNIDPGAVFRVRGQGETVSLGFSSRGTSDYQGDERFFVARGTGRLFDARFIADGAAISVTPADTYGQIELRDGNSGEGASFLYDVSASSPHCLIHSGMTTGSESWTGSTGVLDGSETASTGYYVNAHTDGKIYIENQTGSSTSLRLYFS